jgi:hypothetical protein
MTRRRAAATIDIEPMTRKQIANTDHPDQQVRVRPARIQYLRTGNSRPAAPKVGTVPGVQSLLS